MLVTQQEQLRTDVTALVDTLGPGRSSLIPILQEVKRRHHGIDSDAMQIVADLLDIHPVEVFSVATFYAFLDPAPQGEFVIRLCRTVSCELAGRDNVADQLESELGIAFGETTEDGRFTLDWASCMGMCDQGPALLVNDRIYTRVTPATVGEIIAECRASYSGHAAERKEGYLV
jgi:NADH:ubiquinone oxidoreductase subunit E